MSEELEVSRGCPSRILAVQRPRNMQYACALLLFTRRCTVSLITLALHSPLNVAIRQARISFA